MTLATGRERRAESHKPLLTWRGGEKNERNFAESPLQTGNGESSHSHLYSHVVLEDSARAALMLTGSGRHGFTEQARELLTKARELLESLPERMAMTVQTVFLRNASDRAEFERLMETEFGEEQPVTNFVLQPPCNGAALAIEAWAVSRKNARIERFGANTLAVSYNGVRWVYCTSLEPAIGAQGLHGQTIEVLEQMRAQLAKAGSGFKHIVRTWFYLGGITQEEGELERYRELNRGRADFYRDIDFCRPLRRALVERTSSWPMDGGFGSFPAILQPARIFPASTGIGMAGTGLVASCITVQTDRKDAVILALENPQQTPAYDYSAHYSPKSPKFSRATALLLNGYTTIWISGTASIVDSQSRYLGDIVSQTEQTIDNIERLIAPENFSAHGAQGAGAGLNDLAKIRVYLKHPEDFEKCRAVCGRRFGSVPAIYAVADVCRPELLVEIEGVAFAKRRGEPSSREGSRV